MEHIIPTSEKGIGECPECGGELWEGEFIWSKKVSADLFDQSAEIERLRTEAKKFKADAISDVTRLSVENMALVDALGQLVKYELVIRRWLSKGNNEPMWFEDIMSCFEFSKSTIAKVRHE
jgi:hypothetical protein